MARDNALELGADLFRSHFHLGLPSRLPRWGEYTTAQVIVSARVLHTVLRGAETGIGLG